MPETLLLMGLVLPLVFAGPLLAYPVWALAGTGLLLVYGGVFGAWWSAALEQTAAAVLIVSGLGMIGAAGVLWNRPR